MKLVKPLLYYCKIFPPVKYFTDRSKAVLSLNIFYTINTNDVQHTSFVDHLCYLCIVFVMLSRLLIAVLWSPAGKGLTSWLLFVMSNVTNCDFVTFPCRVLGQV